MQLSLCMTMILPIIYSAQCLIFALYMRCWSRYLLQRALDSTVWAAWVHQSQPQSVHLWSLGLCCSCCRTVHAFNAAATRNGEACRSSSTDVSHSSACALWKLGVSKLLQNAACMQFCCHEERASMQIAQSCCTKVLLDTDNGIKASE